MTQETKPVEQSPNQDQTLVTSHAGNCIGYHEEPRQPKVVRNRPVSAYQDVYEVFRIDDGERHWVVAESIRDAVQQHAVDSLDYETVEEYRRDMGPIHVKRLYPHETIKVEDADGKVVERKAWQWAADHRGVFCSTCW